MTDQLPDDAKGDLVEDLIPVAMRLVEAVRDEGPDAITDVLRTVPTETVDAVRDYPGGPMGVLAVVLAAMVSPDATTGQLLGWTRTLEEPHRGRDRGRPTLTAAERERQRLLAAGVRDDLAILMSAREVEQHGLTTRDRMLRVIDGGRTA